MKVKLVQLDGSIMNLALGKLATYHRNKGDIVGFNIGDPDLIYYSAIFDWTAKKFKGQQPLNGAKAIFGGYPFNDTKLPQEAEFLIPAYDLWGADYSLGYTSRGCIRKCPFCIVPDKEGMIRNYQFVGDFHYPDHKKIILLDNNFFASPRWMQNLDYINDNGLKVCFTQGLDLRIMTGEIAELLADTKYSDLNFKSHRLFFAFDSIKDELKIRRGLELLLDAGHNPNNLYVYVLIGYDSTFKEDFKRCQILWDEYKVHPFPMRFNDRTDDIYLNRLSKWGCRPAGHRNHTFKEFLEHYPIPNFAINSEYTGFINAEVENGGSK